MENERHKHVITYISLICRITHIMSYANTHWTSLTLIASSLVVGRLKGGGLVIRSLSVGLNRGLLFPLSPSRNKFPFAPTFLLVDVTPVASAVASPTSFTVWNTFPFDIRNSVLFANFEGLVAWLSAGNAFDSINEVILRWAGLVLRWVTACGQVNHSSICNQPPRSTQPSIPPG